MILPTDNSFTGYACSACSTVHEYVHEARECCAPIGVPECWKCAVCDLVWEVKEHAHKCCSLERLQKELDQFKEHAEARPKRYLNAVQHIQKLTEKINKHKELTNDSNSDANI